MQRLRQGPAEAWQTTVACSSAPSDTEQSCHRGRSRRLHLHVHARTLHQRVDRADCGKIATGARSGLWHSEQRINKKPIRSGLQVMGGLAALVALLVGAALPDRAEAQASRAGWWVRVDTKKTEATGIGFQLGAGKNERRDWRTWRTGEPAEFALPGDFAQRPQIYLHATANPDDEDVWFCVFSKSAGVRRFDFDTTEGTLLKQTDRDSECQ